MAQSPETKVFKTYDDLFPTETGTLDCLQINDSNKNTSLSTFHPRKPPGWTERGLNLSSEYFAYQFFILVGIPAPSIQIIETPPNSVGVKSKYVFKIISDRKDMFESENFRWHPSLFIRGLAEVILQEADNTDALYFENNMMVSIFCFDRERSGNVALSAEEIPAEIEKWLKKNAGKPATLEQQLAFVFKLKEVLSGSPSLFDKIFFNSRVQATPKLISSEVKTIHRNYKINIERLIEYYTKTFPTEFKGFSEREEIRRQIADRVLKELKVDTSHQPALQQTLIAELRGRFYFPDDVLGPSKLDSSIANTTFMAKVIAGEQKRQALILLEVQLNQRTAEEIIKLFNNFPHLKDNEIFQPGSKKGLTEETADFLREMTKPRTTCLLGVVSPEDISKMRESFEKDLAEVVRQQRILIEFREKTRDILSDAQAAFLDKYEIHEADLQRIILEVRDNYIAKLLKNPNITSMVSIMAIFKNDVLTSDVSRKIEEFLAVRAVRDELQRTLGRGLKKMLSEQLPEIIKTFPNLDPSKLTQTFRQMAKNFFDYAEGQSLKPDEISKKLKEFQGLMDDKVKALQDTNSDVFRAHQVSPPEELRIVDEPHPLVWQAREETGTHKPDDTDKQKPASPLSHK